eukprot:SAG31_NODE_47_length_30979_cov_41.708841_24_plen_93_part_00
MRTFGAAGRMRPLVFLCCLAGIATATTHAQTSAARPTNGRWCDQAAEDPLPARSARTLCGSASVVHALLELGMSQRASEAVGEQVNRNNFLE